MKEIDYATAVARVRVNENSLLDSGDIERIIASKNYDEAISILSEKGFLSIGEDVDTALSGIVTKAFSLIREIAPKKEEFDFLIIKNDFHNLKTVLKGIITDTDYSTYLIHPNTVDISLIETAVKEKNFSLLPHFMQDTAKQAYDYFVTTSDGQLSDLCIDRGSLETVLELTKNSENTFIRDLGENIVATANMRIAVRASKFGQSEKLLKTALADCKSLSKDSLITAACEGIDKIGEYLSSSSYSGAADALSESVSAFEKWCDNALISFVSSARYSAFGPAPLAAYIIKCEALQKTLRIILSAKNAELSEEVIRQRVRKTY